MAKVAGKVAAVTAAATIALGGAGGTAQATDPLPPGWLVIFNPGGDHGAVAYNNLGQLIGVAERLTVPPLDSRGCHELAYGQIIVKKGTPVCPPAASAAAPADGDAEQEETGESVPV